MSSSLISPKLRPKWHFSVTYAQALPAPLLGPQAQTTPTNMQNGTQVPPRHVKYGMLLQLCNHRAPKSPLPLRSLTPMALESQSGSPLLAPPSPFRTTARSPAAAGSQSR